MVMPGAQPTPNRAALHPVMPPGSQVQHDNPELTHSSVNAAKRRSRKPTDKNLPEGIEDCLIDPDLAQRYKDLRDFEQRLDATVTRKRLDMIDTIHRHGKVSRSTRYPPGQASTAHIESLALPNPPRLDQQYGGEPTLASWWHEGGCV